MHSLIPRIFASIVAVIVLLGSLFIGAIAFLALFGFMVLGWLAFVVRTWWLQRRYRKAAQPGAGARRTVEGDYRVMDDRDDRK